MSPAQRVAFFLDQLDEALTRLENAALGASDSVAMADVRTLRRQLLELAEVSARDPGAALERLAMINAQEKAVEKRIEMAVSREVEIALPRLPGDYQSLRAVSLRVREDQVPKILPSELATRREPDPDPYSHGLCKDRGTPQVPASRIDKVHFSVASPPAVEPGQKFIVDVWAHLGQQRAEVLRQVERARPQTDAPSIIRPKGPFKIERGTTLFVRLRFDDFDVEPPEDVILWDGEIGNASFEVTVPTAIPEGMKTGFVTVHWEGRLQIARVPLQLLVAAKIVPTAPTTQPLQHIRKAFASYASPDRNEVLGRIQGMQKIAPDLKVFLDVVDLRSGEDWETKLWQVIPENDVFYLFWSAAAKASPWVEKEWRCALDRRGLGFIDPVPLVSPDEVQPPEELAKKHFNDWGLAYRRVKSKTD
jgi:hypothetical protein